MKRPGIVTGLACLNLMGALSAVWLFDRKAQIGVDPIFLGSVFPVRSQWNWITATIGLNLVTTVGLFRGWGWARWLAVILCISRNLSAFLWVRRLNKSLATRLRESLTEQ
ncbi:hypothetical protein, partial [Burkholderia ubonensis]|uniref:hypothetical protein n=1 Tax=Burkholderia ubonensis TaxID=101571 RepID=UPI001C314598